MYKGVWGVRGLGKFGEIWGKLGWEICLLVETNTLKLDCDDDIFTTLNILKNTDLYTLNELYGV